MTRTRRLRLYDIAIPSLVGLGVVLFLGLVIVGIGEVVYGW